MRIAHFVVLAATYSPTRGSTIGAEELNFSVRNGKRWNLLAVTTNNSLLTRVHLTTNNSSFRPALSQEYLNNIFS